MPESRRSVFSPARSVWPGGVRRRRESERPNFDARPSVGPEGKQPPSCRLLEPYQASPEPTPVDVVPNPREPTIDNNNITVRTPENVIGETLVVQGRVEFQNLLRIDGRFEGELIGNGSLIIGPTAEVISNLQGLDEVYVEGILIGDCICNKMQIRFAGCVTGNLHCGSLGMDPSVVLKGSANINPRDKTDKSKPKSTSAPRQKRSQSRVVFDDASSSSKASTTVASPESVSSRAPGYEEERSQSCRPKLKSKSSGDVWPDEGGKGVSPGELIVSSVAISKKEETAAATGSVVGAVIPKVGEAMSVPVRSRPPVNPTNKIAGTV